MARPIAGATISFGLVSIPVKLYSATQPSAGVSFNLLHGKCGTRVKQQYICPHDNELVSRDEMVKGYEVSKDEYVIFKPEELKALEERATETIDIAQFVPVSSIDPVYFDKPYYLSAEKGGEKAYMLLAEAMRESGRAALARYAARGKQYLVMVRPTTEKPGGLVLQQLLYADEVRPLAEVPLPDTEVREPELKLARQLIDQIAAETFEPTLYHDDVRERIQADIERKKAGQEIATSAPEPQPARIIDLMEALKASLAAAPQAPAEADEERKGAKRGSAPATKSESKRARAGKR
jgi:DNA end-binding protein Ku